MDLSQLEIVLPEGDVLRALLGLAAAVFAGWIVHLVVFSALKRVSRHTHTSLDDLVWEHCRRPSRLLLPLLFLQLAMPLALPALPALISPWLSRLLAALLALSLGWLLISLAVAGEALILSRHTLDAADNLLARKVHTQIRILRRIVVFVIGLLTLAGILVTYEPVRELGTGLLASAGLAGVILGFAAQKTLGNLLAGIQIALTQPVRIDDVVIVEGEWGRIEQITLTYVVLHIWDQRRLVIPISYFLDEPFQNWTRVSAEILGTVFLWVDYSVPVDAVRAELQRILDESELWDGRVGGLLVTDASDRAVQLRALVSAADSAAAWDLRCHVRERLIAFLQREYPGSLPRLRAEVEGEKEGRESAGAEVADRRADRDP